MDNMIAYMNEHHSDKYHFRYSTPSDYVDAIAKKKVEWPTKSDDLFPYADSPDAYWTGYFSSRANDKEYIRRASSNFHASSQLFSQKAISDFAGTEEVSALMDASILMQDVLGINQHHDAVTGTAKQAVADDYANRLFKGMEKNNIQYSKLMADKFSIESELSQCFKTNSTYLDCPISNYASEENYTMTTFVHNPSSLDMTSARIAVPHGNFDIKILDQDKFTPAKATVTCHQDHIENGEEIESCFMDI